MRFVLKGVYVGGTRIKMQAVVLLSLLRGVTDHMTQPPSKGLSTIDVQRFADHEVVFDQKEYSLRHLIGVAPLLDEVLIGGSCQVFGAGVIGRKDNPGNHCVDPNAWSKLQRKRAGQVEQAGLGDSMCEHRWRGQLTIQVTDVYHYTGLLS